MSRAGATGFAHTRDITQTGPEIISGPITFGQPSANVKAVGNLAFTYAHDLVTILKGVRDPVQPTILDDTVERTVVDHVIKR